MDKAGKVKFIKLPGYHLGMDIQEMQQYVVPYLIDGAQKNKADAQVVHWLKKGSCYGQWRKKNYYY